MRFAAPTPAATGAEPPQDLCPVPALPVMRGQVFEATTDAAGGSSEPLPLRAGVRLRVTVLAS
jgi:hypothetical protein